MYTRKVLHILPSFGLGGTEKVAQLIACGLDRTTYEVAVYSPTDGPRAAFVRAAGIPVIIHDDVQRCVNAFVPDIVHIHRGGWPEPALLARIRGGLRFRADGTRRTRVVETNVFGRQDASVSGRIIDCTVFVSHFCARRYGAVHGVEIALPRYTTVYNPVETDFLATHTRSPAVRDYTRPVVGRLSRADAGKWSTLALEMLPPLVRAVPQVRYAVVGGIGSAFTYVREHDLEEHVTFLPPVTDLPALAHFLDSLSVFAHANDTGESFGLVIAEAMAAGLPVVTHACPLPKDNAQVELVDHNVTGLVAHNAEDYAAAVAWLLGHPESARRMGMAGQNKAQKLFAVAVVVAQWQRLYEYVCPEETA
ncbi:MAG: glycosyltransferase family 4 protein [Desulfovibrionaceae bacterium]